MLQRLTFSRQLLASIISIPSLLIVTLLIYFNTGMRESSLLALTISLLIVLVALIVFGLYYTRKLSIQIVKIKDNVRSLAEGKLAVLSLKGKDEIAAIAGSLNTLTSNLKQTAEFTRQIGEGNLSAYLQPTSDSDLLGHSLVKMKNDLAAIHAEDQKRKWSAESLARFTDVLQSNRNLKSLCNEIIRNLVKVLDSNQGAIFIINDEQPHDTFLEMKACYAYNRSKTFTQRIELGNGILGQAFLEKETIYLKEIPRDFVRITSGLGEATPTSLLIVPLKVNETTVGLVEIASFTEFEKHHIHFIEKLGENIAHAITSFRINENTSRLLTESQHQTEQMKAQEEELRQNQEELQATQEEISRKYNALFKQLTEMNYTSKFDQLKSINFAKKRSIEYYFDIIRSQIITFSENKTIVEAVKAFRAAFYEIDTPSAQELVKIKNNLSQYYQSDFLKKLNDNATETKTIADYLPEEVRPLILQYHYISSNTHPTGEKHLLNKALDGSSYSSVHSEYHPLIKSFLEKFGYYDIFLIDHVTGDMLYSVFKEVDYATSLFTGPYHTTNFGRVVKQAAESTNSDFVTLVDFEPYDPSYRAPASFIACPIYDHDEKIGILVFQMPINRINQILTGNNNWEEDGLGETGETYMVGDDYKLRSISRGLIQNQEQYLSRLSANGYSDSVINQVRKTNTSILIEEVKNDSTRKALSGMSGTKIDHSSRGNFLNAYTPLDIKDMNWILMSSMTEEEASQKIDELRRL